MVRDDVLTRKFAKYFLDFLAAAGALKINLEHHPGDLLSRVHIYANNFYIYVLAILNYRNSIYIYID